METPKRKPSPKPRKKTKKYEKSLDHVDINDDTRSCLLSNTQCMEQQQQQQQQQQEQSHGVNELLNEVDHLKQQLATVKEEREEFKDEVKFLKYQLAYRTQVQQLQKTMNGAFESKRKESDDKKSTKSVRFSSNISIKNTTPERNGGGEDSESVDLNASFTDKEWEEYLRLKTEKEELEDVLHDFYHDSKMRDKHQVLVGDIDSDETESTSSLICRVLVDYEKLCEERRISDEEKAKLSEDQVQLNISMAKLREQLHDTVDSNIEELEELNRENEELRYKLSEKADDIKAAFLKSHEMIVNNMKLTLEFSKTSTLVKVIERLTKDLSLAEKQFGEVKRTRRNSTKDEKDAKVKRTKSLPPKFREPNDDTIQRGGLLRELKACKDLQESQRKQIQKILEEKLDLEVKLSEIKRDNVKLKAERRTNIKTKSKHVQTAQEFLSTVHLSPPDTWQDKCKDLEEKLNAAKAEKCTAEEEKVSLLMSLDANIEKTYALEEQLKSLQVKLQKDAKRTSETDGGLRSSYRKELSEVKVDLERIRVQEQDKQIGLLKRENETAREKLKKSEEMLKTLQNCLKEITDEKNDLLDTIEELTEDKAELEKSRAEVETKLVGGKREKFVADEADNVNKKEKKLLDDIEATRLKLVDLDDKIVDVLSLMEKSGPVKKPNSKQNNEQLISSAMSNVAKLKEGVSKFKMAPRKDINDNVDKEKEVETLSREKHELESKVKELNVKMRNITASLESSYKSNSSYETRISKELEKMRDAKSALEKSFSVARKREAELERQLKEIRSQRDSLQESYDELFHRSKNESTELSRLKKEIDGTQASNEKLSKEVTELREDLEGAVDDRDELLELLDRIVCENGADEQRRASLGQKVERIRERSRSEENLLDATDSKQQKAIDEKYLVSSQITVEMAAPPLPDDEQLRARKDAVKKTGELVEENGRLRQMFGKMFEDQKSIELSLSSLSDKEVTSSNKSKQTQNKALTSANMDNGELQKLQDAMVATNNAINDHIKQLQSEKTHNKQGKSSVEKISQEKTVLEAKLEKLLNDKVKVEKEVDTLEGKCRQYEKDTAKIVKEKDQLQVMLDESKSRMEDLKEHMDSLTEINKDLRDTNERVVKSSKEAEKKMSKMNRESSNAESKSLESMNKRLQNEVTQLTTKNVSLETELTQAKGNVSKLKTDNENYSKKLQELESTVEANQQELDVLRNTDVRLSKLQEKVGSMNALQTENEALKKTIAEHEDYKEETDAQLAKFKKDVENAQRYIKVVSQENDSLRDALADWEREASKIRQHMLHGNRSPSLPRKELGATGDDSAAATVGTLEAMQIEMDAMNKHRKTLRNQNKELAANLEAITKENDATKDKNIELLTKYDLMSKEIEKMNAEITSLRQNLKNEYDEEKGALQAKYEKLEQENLVLKNSLGSTLDEEKALGDCLKKLIITPPIKEGKRLKKSKSKNTVNEEQFIIKTEVDGLAASKPDLIQHSKEVKESSAIEEAKLKKEYCGVEKGGDSKHDVQDLVKGISNERATLKSLCDEVAKVFCEVSARDAELQKHLEEAGDKKGKKKDTKGNKAALEKALQAKLDLETEVKKKDTEIHQLVEQKTTLENETNVMKEKSDKLQVVFRALVTAMEEKKPDGSKAKENGGPVSLIDHMKNIKARYQNLVTEKETLEQRVAKLEKDIQAKETEKVESEKAVEARKPTTSSKETLEDKERMLDELLLSSARDKRHYVEKLQEVYEEFDRVKSQLATELKKQRKNSGGQVTALEKVYEEFEASVSHTETFVQSVVHERRVTVVANTAAEKDPNLELAKENEELIGRINAIKSSRRRETKALKEEIEKVTEEKEEVIQEMEKRYTTEVTALKEECEKITKEREETVAKLMESWAKEVHELTQKIAKMTEVNEKAQESLKKESREAIRRLEEQVKTLRQNVDKVVAEKKSGELQLGELKRSHAAEVKEKDRAIESEVSHVRANWAESERKVRELSEERDTINAEFQRLKLEQSEQSSKSSLEIKRLKTSLETVQREALASEDDFSKERERLHQTIAMLEQSFKKAEMSGLERTQHKIGDFQRHLNVLQQKNKQLENAKMASEVTLNTELERMRRENASLCEELRAQQGQRKIAVNVNEQQQWRGNLQQQQYGSEHVKVITTAAKSNMASPVENVPSYDNQPVKKVALPLTSEKPMRPGPPVTMTLPIEKTRVGTNVESVPTPPVPAAKPIRRSPMENTTALHIPRTAPPPKADKPRRPPEYPPVTYDRAPPPVENAPRLFPSGAERPKRPSSTGNLGRVDKPKPSSPVEHVPYHGDPQRRVKVKQSEPVHKSRVSESNVRRPSGEHNDTVCEELGAMFRQFTDDWSEKTTTSSVILARPIQKDDEPLQQQQPQPEWEPGNKERPARVVHETRRVARQQDTPSPTITGRIISQPYPQRVGYVQEDNIHRIRAEPRVASADNLNRDIRRVHNDGASHGRRKRRMKGPSMGSDDVFVAENALQSQAQKNSDLYRSRSLDNLIDAGGESKKSANNVPKAKTKLPKSYSGPRKLESTPWAGGTGQTSGRGQGTQRAQRVTPLKGMEYV